ncbi:MAG: hypothetical protein KF911_03710 [Pseudomonadales bacterium]|nr:hypothetical protein [Pseudomonadales bacterium]
MPGNHSMTRAALLASVLAASAALADGPFPLDEDTLDRITAGTQTDARELLEFEFAHAGSQGRALRGSGTLELVAPGQAHTLLLGDGAQQQLRALVNINAIESQVAVLLNLNINIDSSVGSLVQQNGLLRATDALPARR